MVHHEVGDGFDLLETTIEAVHSAFESSAVTAEQLVEAYLSRIEAYDDRLNAVISVNDNAIQRARRLDATFETDGPVGPLHGIPTLVKDNHDTADMPTTAGSSPLAEFVPECDAVVVERLRAAGAVIVGKANLQELSFGVDSVSSLGGEVHNPYALDRRPAGSSGGTAAALAANLATIGTGTDTCSSVRSPPAFTNLVGIRPTRGLVSRTGLIPLSITQDTAGPLARTVGDTARLLQAMVGFDPADPVTAAGVDQVPEAGYTSHLNADGLDGARIGILRDAFEVTDPDTQLADTATRISAVTERAIEDMAAAGATLVDDISLVDDDLVEAARVVSMEFARDFDAYLADRAETPVDSLRELVETGEIAPSIERRIREAGVLDRDGGDLDENLEYLRALARRDTIRTEIIAGLVENDLDAVLYPPSTVLPATIPEQQPFSEMRCERAAHSGLPALTMQAGFTDDQIPVGVELLGRPFTEPRLIELGYGFEQATDHRRPPEQFP